MIENSVILINRLDDQPTHLFCAWKTLSIPDLSISSKDIQRICDREACTQLGGSDHLPVLLKVILTEQTTSQKKEPSWNYKKADWSKFENPTDVLCRKLDTDRLGKRVVGNDQQNRDRSHLLLSVSKERGVHLTDQRTRNPSARHPSVPRNEAGQKTYLVSPRQYHAQQSSRENVPDEETGRNKMGSQHENFDPGLHCNCQTPHGVCLQCLVICWKD